MEELLKLAKKEKIEELESAWMAAVTEEVTDLDAMLRVPEVLADRGREEVAESLLWFLADALKEAGRPAQALQAVRRGARCLPRSQVLRDLLVGLYGEHYADRPDIEPMVRTALGNRDGDLDAAVECMDRFLALGPGSYVLDSQRGEVGRVVGFDAEQGGLEVEFPDSGQKCYGPALAARLEVLEANDFRALCAFEREKLQELAFDDPEEFVQLVLSALDRRMELRRMRIYVEPVLDSWSKWWSSAREKLRRSSAIGMTEGRSPSLFLRRKPLTHGERLLRRLKSLDEPAEKLARAMDILEEARKHLDSVGDALPEVADDLMAVIEAEREAGSPLAVAGAAVLDAFAEDFTSLELPAPPRPQDLPLPEGPALVRAADESRVVNRTLRFLRDRQVEEWKALAISLLPVARREVCQVVARMLLDAGDTEALAAACREILDRPDVRPGAVAWLWHECAASSPREPFDELDPVNVLFKLLSVAAALERDPSLPADKRKELVGDLRSALLARDGEALRGVLQTAAPEQLKSVSGMVERSPVLTGGMQARIVNMLRGINPELFVRRVPLWEQDAIYTTKEGLEKRKAELEHVVNVRIPEVVQEIGEAASFGDISDNAEYQSAIRERSRLADLAARMRDEVSRARIITRELADVEHVTVGSRVRARRLSTGEEQTFVFLGPWDADPDSGIYAYNAALAEVFMGKEVGETVTFAVGPEERRWEILSVEPAL